MARIILFSIVLSIIYSIDAFSGGAPQTVCDDMTPVHLVGPKTSKLPYNVTVDRSEVKGGEIVEISIQGSYKGVLVEVRNGKRAAGTFIVSGDDRFVKTIDCHGSKKNALTHKNSFTKKDKTFKWKAPRTPGKYTVVVTVVKEALTFWARKPTAVINVV
ncbi:putative defense protein 1 [Diabrotica undecimpunctata]|uniref:putative defense protein 1 n=1 Tax=Diabrotica undecimpunctata TaxID=50387 RepID=UPI003B641582